MKKIKSQRAKQDRALLVQVKWLDACTPIPWLSPDELRESGRLGHVCQSTGWLFEVNKTNIVLYGTWSTQNRCNTIVIPCCSVLSVMRLDAKHRLVKKWRKLK